MTYRELTASEVADWINGHVSHDDAIETEHGVLVPVEA